MLKEDTKEREMKMNHKKENNMNNNHNQEENDMKTFLVKLTGSNEWIEMQGESGHKLSQELRKQGKSGIIKPKTYTQEETVNTIPTTPASALIKLEKLTPEEIANSTRSSNR